MNIQARIVSVKRHTLGYVISGRQYTRPQAVKLARQQKLAHARIVNSVRYGPHITGVGINLYDLPTLVGFRRSSRMTNRKVSSRRN